MIRKSMNKFMYLISYCAIVFVIMGCNESKRVPVNQHFWAPNSFSPNGDGLNETFRILPIYGTHITQFRITIFNDQLKQVYLSNTFDEFQMNGWDGKFNETNLPAGFYDYQLIYTASEDSIIYEDFISTATVQLFR